MTGQSWNGYLRGLCAAAALAVASQRCVAEQPYRGVEPLIAPITAPVPTKPLDRLPQIEQPLESPNPADPGPPFGEQSLPDPRDALAELDSNKDVAWWKVNIQHPLRQDVEHVPVTVDSLLLDALRHSHQVQVYGDTPLIRELAILEADAAFDWTQFIDTRWDQLSEPVGNELTTGGPPRFRDRNWYGIAGLRRRNLAGGEVELSQRAGFQDNNSVFFVPNNQGTARLTLSYTQPLLRGAGRVYNSSLILLARIDAELAMDEFSRQLQDYLLETTRAYWGLYLERGLLLQKRRLYWQAEEIRRQLESRRALGTVKSQLVRAEAAVATRRSELLRAENRVRNAEAKIRALVNAPNLGKPDEVELIPIQSPASTATPIELYESVEVAVQNRPEIMAAIREIRAACIRLNMSKNELLPALNMVLMTYTSGLRGNTDIGTAWVDMFSVGEPSYGVGLQYDQPIGNRAARARYTRRQLEVRQLQNQFRATVENVKLEVEIAVREIETSAREIELKRQAVLATQGEVENIEERWRLLPESEASASLMLDNLLDAQERLAQAQLEYLSANVALNLAQMNHKRALGVLLQAEQVMLSRVCEGDVPRHILDKASETSSLPDAAESLPAPYILPPTSDE